MNLAHLLARSANAYPDLPAVALGDRVLQNHAALAGRVARLAGGLLPQQRVALVMTNCPQHVETELRRLR